MRDASVSFRQEVRPQDVEAVRAIVESTGFFYDFEVEVAVELVQERLSRGLASEYYFVFADERAGNTVAYACFGPIPCTLGSFDLYWIAVDQRAQRQGLGGAVLREAERLMRSGLGSTDGGRLPPARCVYIETSSQAKYAPTRQFYDRCGYRLEATLRDYYAAGDDKLIYVKALA